MRLAVIRQRYTPFGGAERFVERALDTLAARGVAADVAARGTGRATPRACSRRSSSNPPYLGRLWRDRSFARAVRASRREIGRDARPVARADRLLRYLSRRRRSACGVARRAACRRDVAGAPARARKPLPSLRAGRRTAALREPRGFEAVICISQMVQNDIRERFGLPVERLPIIYNAIDPEEFSPRLSATRAATRASLDIDDDRVVFLLVGSGYERKGVGRAIEALAGVPEPAHLVVVGHDRESGALSKRLPNDSAWRSASRSRVRKRIRGRSTAPPMSSCCPRCTTRCRTRCWRRWPADCRSSRATAAAPASSSPPTMREFVCGARDIGAIADAMRALLTRSRRASALRPTRCAPCSTLTPAAMAARLLDLYQTAARRPRALRADPQRGDRAMRCAILTPTAARHRSPCSARSCPSSCLGRDSLHRRRLVARVRAPRVLLR